jgi:hypothetical protein
MLKEKVYHMKMCKMIFLITLLSGYAMALNAPYLSSVQLADSVNVKLTWRNNDLNTAGYYIWRATTDNSFKCIDTLTSASIINFIDVFAGAGSKYYYKLQAFSANAVSDFSNVDSIITVSKWKRPGITTAWDKNNRKIIITYTDSSTVETSLNIYKVHEQEKPKVIYTKFFESPNPIEKSWVIDDASININQWYKYFVVVYKGIEGSLISDTTTVFTYDGSALPDASPPPKYLAGETDGYLGGMPLQNGTKCFKFGDTIVVLERPDGREDTSYSIFDVSDPSNIKFCRYGSWRYLYSKDRLVEFANQKCLYFFEGELQDCIQSIQFKNGEFVIDNSVKPIIYDSSGYKYTESAPIKFLQDQDLMIFARLQCYSSSGALYGGYLYGLMYTSDSICVKKNVGVLAGCGPNGEQYKQKIEKYLVYQNQFFIEKKYYNYNGIVREVTITDLTSENKYNTLIDTIPNRAIGPELRSGYAVDNWFTTNFPYIYIDTIKHVVFLINKDGIRVDKLKSTTAIRNIVSQKTSVLPKEMIIHSYNLSGRVTTKSSRAPQLLINENNKITKKELIFNRKIKNQR